MVKEYDSRSKDQTIDSRRINRFNSKSIKIVPKTPKSPLYWVTGIGGRGEGKCKIFVILASITSQKMVPLRWL